MRNKIIRLISANLINTFLTGVLGIYVSRVLGPEGRGVLALVMGSVLLVSMLLSFGSPHAAAYFIRHKPQSAKAILSCWNCVLLFEAFVSAVVLLWTGGVLTSFFLGGYKLDLILVILLIGIIVISSDIGVVGASVIAKGDTTRYSFSTNLGTVVTFLVTILLLNLINLTEWKLHGVLTGYFAGQVLTALFLRKAYSTYLDYSDSQNDGTIKWVQILNYGLKAQIGSIASLVFKRVDLFIIGYLVNPSAVGFYAIGLSLRDLALIVPRAMAGLIGGEMTDHQVQSSGLGIQLFKKSIWVNIGFSIAVTLFGVVSFPVVIPLTYGDAYSDAVLPAILILGSLIPLSLAIIVNPAICAYGKPMYMSFGNVVGGLLGLITIWYFTSSFGLVGGAVSSILASGILLAINTTIFNFFVKKPFSVVDIQN